MDTQPNPNQVIQPNQPAGSANPSGELNAPVAPPIQTGKAPKKSNKKVILFAVIIVAILAAGAYFILGKKDKKPAVTEQPQTSQQESVQAATTEDIDQAAKDIDSTIQKADSVKDVGAGDLNDAALGL